MGWAVRAEAARLEPMPGVREAVVAVDGTLVTPMQPASWTQGQHTYTHRRWRRSACPAATRPMPTPSLTQRRPKYRRSCAARALARSPPPRRRTARCAGARMVGLGWWDGMGGAGGGSTGGANARIGGDARFGDGCGWAGGGGGGDAMAHSSRQPASQSLRHSHQLGAMSSYVHPQAVEEVSMPGNNQSDADAVFDAAATKVQAVLRGATARKRSVAGVRLSPHSNPNPNPNPHPHPKPKPNPNPTPKQLRPQRAPPRRAPSSGRGGGAEV